MADGSVIISVDLDTEKADKELAELSKSIKKTEREIKVLSDEKSTIFAKGLFKKADLDAEEKKLNALKEYLVEIKTVAKDISFSEGARAAAKLEIPKAQFEVQKQSEKVRSLRSEYKKIENSVSQYDKDIGKATRKLESQKEEAGELAKKINSVSRASLKMKDAQDKAEKSMRKFGLRLREVVRSALVFTLITQSLAKFREWMGKVLKTNTEAQKSFAKLKGALLTAAQPLVEKLVPAAIMLADVLTRILTVVAQVTSALAGKTVEESKEAADALNKETEALEGVGDAAKEATKQLASFDEINRLTSDSSTSVSQGISPDFSALSFGVAPEWLLNITLTMHDILFEWENLTAEDFLKKAVASLTTLAGSVIGFSLGGVGGAVVGMTVGASIGALISNLLFNGDKELGTSEILNSLCLALAAIAGAVIGFKVGGVNGAAIGITVGVAVTAGVGSLLFDGDGVVNTEEVLKSLCGSLLAIAGTVLGFSIGGAGGAIIGVLVGAGVTAGVSSLLFNNDGRISNEELLKNICTTLFSLASGVLGFFAGGAKGAAIGVLVGASVSALISNLLFDNDGTVSNEEVVKSICTALVALVGGIIGFTVGGPGGAVVGVMIGAGVTAALSNLIFDNDGVVSGTELLKGLCGVLGALVGGIIGFSVGGPAGAVIGIVIGATVTIKLTDILFEGFNTLKEKVPGFTGIGPDYSWLFKSTDVPGLATGSVVPPNREFLAVLGDNKTETEVVSPLSTMKQAFIEAMQESGGMGAGTVEVKLYLDGKQIAKNQVKHINDMSIAAGKSVILV